MIKLWISDEIYGNGFWFLTNYTNKELKKYITGRHPDYEYEENFGDDHRGAVANIYSKENELDYMYMCVRNFTRKNPIEWDITYVHELRHLIDTSMHSSGVEEQAPAMEAHAYYTAYIHKKIIIGMIKIWNKEERKKKPKKKKK